MGSYTDVAIAIDKETWARHALLKKVPTILAQVGYVEVDGALHWYIPSQKWYRMAPEVQEVHEFFDLLEEEGDIKTGETFTAPNGNTAHYTRSRYGCLLLSDEDGTEEYGDPYAFDIGRVDYIDCPGRDAQIEREKKHWQEQQLAKEASE